MGMFSNTNWKIRMIIAMYLKSILTNVSKEMIREEFYSEIKELLIDEELYVKLETLDSYLNMLNLFNP
jgi:hypothetical protein